MGRDIFVTARDQIPPGEGRAFLVEGQTIALFHCHDGSIHATQAHCPHRNGPLADGLIGGHSLVCPLHDRVFDLKTGCGLSHERLNLATFAVRVDADGRIFVDPVAIPAATAASA